MGDKELYLFKTDNLGDVTISSDMDFIDEELKVIQAFLTIASFSISLNKTQPVLGESFLVIVKSILEEYRIINSDVYSKKLED